ncbi:glycoside hydrolase family 15 protein [Marinicrinis sediminis]|uniref:Glycoside hydrolase family 15 protein n=1 Tax=Marinicrinis sediminis TaxID=1652465 RepID=A0ABW5RDG9_9BACL
MLQESYRVLDQLRLPNGLYVASPSDNYSFVWIRDCVYIAFAYLEDESDTYERTFYGLFDLFRKYEWKLDILVEQKPHYEWEYVHARYDARTIDEIHDEKWGHVQHDMIGAFLFGIGEGVRRKKRMLRDESDQRIVQKLVRYLHNVQYWKDPDNGIWEEWREMHSSSLGACLAGLRHVRSLCDVPGEMIEAGLDALMKLYPRESADKSSDLAQLSLIYPYQILHGAMAEKIVEQIERELLRERGVIRYRGDSYYSTHEKEYGRGYPLSFYEGTEAEWTFGLPWLAICHQLLGHHEKALSYVKRTEQVMTRPGELPELYYSGQSRPNPNTPLGWSSAMYILAKQKLTVNSLHDHQTSVHLRQLEI